MVMVGALRRFAVRQCCVKSVRSTFSAVSDISNWPSRRLTVQLRLEVGTAKVKTEGLQESPIASMGQIRKSTSALLGFSRTLAFRHFSMMKCGALLRAHFVL
eukprot:3402449-Pyramimonas_sp.AAC.1